MKFRFPKFIQTIRDNAAIKRFLTRRQQINEAQEKVNAVEAIRANLIKAKDEARAKVMKTMDPDDVKQFVDAQTEYDRYDRALSPVLNHGTGYFTDHLKRGAECNEIVMDALNAVKARLNAEADLIGNEHQERLKKSGMGGEHGPSPAEKSLREKALELQERANSMSNWTEDTVVAPWQWADMIAPDL